MAEDRVTIAAASVFDNVDERQIEFTGEASSEQHAFALRYDVLEAIGGAIPTDPLPVFERHMARIQTLAANALARDPDRDPIVISENDLI